MQGADAIGERLGNTGPHDARRRRPGLAAEHARIRQNEIEGRDDHDGAGNDAEQLRVDLVPRLRAEEPAGLEGGEQVGRVQADAAGDIGRHDVARQVAWRDHAVDHLGDRTKGLGGRDVRLASDARGDETHDDGERDRHEAGPERDMEQPDHEKNDTRGEDHEAHGKPPLGRLDRGQTRFGGPPTTEDAREAGKGAGDALVVDGEGGQPRRHEERGARPEGPGDDGLVAHSSHDALLDEGWREHAIGQQAAEQERPAGAETHEGAAAEQDDLGLDGDGPLGQLATGEGHRQPDGVRDPVPRVANPGDDGGEHGRAREPGRLAGAVA